MRQSVPSTLWARTGPTGIYGAALTILDPRAPPGLRFRAGKVRSHPHHKMSLPLKVEGTGLDQLLVPTAEAWGVGPAIWVFDKPSGGFWGKLKFENC